MLPETLRPRGVSYRRFTPGLDLSANFAANIKSIDPNIYFVYHPYRVIWDDVINQYEGPLEDPRFHIHEEFGQECWGWVLKDNKGAPIPEGSWHLWRLCWPYGWAHIVKIESSDPEYLQILVNRLDLQAKFRDQYSDKQWNRKMAEDKEKESEKYQKDSQDLFNAVQEENAWFMKKAMENFDRGIIAPTNPQKEQIISYPGQTHRSRVKRLLEDEEGGLITKDK